MSVPNPILFISICLCELIMQMNSVKSINAITLEITSKQLAKVEKKEKSLSEKIKLLASICRLDPQTGEQLSNTIDTLLGCAKKTYEEKKSLDMLKELANGDMSILENIKQTEKSLNEELFQFCSSINIICDRNGVNTFFPTPDANVVWEQINSLFEETKTAQANKVAEPKVEEAVAPVKTQILAKA